MLEDTVLPEFQREPSQSSPTGSFKTALEPACRGSELNILSELVMDQLVSLDLSSSSKSFEKELTSGLSWHSSSQLVRSIQTNLFGDVLLMADLPLVGRPSAGSLRYLPHIEREAWSGGAASSSRVRCEEGSIGLWCCNMDVSC